MGSLNIEKVKKAFGPVEVLKGIDLEVNDGEFVVFVGPSGCGKSTLLRVIAGLEDSTSGRVVIDGQDVSVTPPAKRGIAMVFQTYALYPHLTVKNNMSLGLKQAGTPAAEIDRRIGVASSMLSLEPYLERRPAELSGGQRQRVAIGRAVVREPKLFLFDEPLSNLDAALRVNTRLEIAQLHRRLKATMIYVTHDQVEAMTLADKIVVLNAGRIEQIGGPMELYNSPANEFVAGFIGSPKMNFIDGARLGETAKTVGVRPEHLTVDTTSGAWKGTVVHAEHLGADTNLYLDCEKAGLLTVRIFGVYNAEPGSTLYATPDPAKTYRFGADGRVLK
ncbi:MAG: ATP-binding cassette domain-containing protein [Mesorhizobium sp.]|uniref:ABC transporter ATP-binding protein n=1 Tax=unclassified Mesorhizobium TaxID=325217 RepID=UPI000F755E4A|nr:MULTISPECIES: ABC transporter ATP-binding protein [unclassified Mesorhizobium]AZO49448.1 ABC transporter ATP-binding protein [Mesorhizobium sp. M4B.F.Ca.ET.058.02.1.1]RVC46928.1 ATP-binding cassette domain-containing protein [Mesorhizobium sp. M4A.F.Ca.ET.090.04.2.1]RWC51682.1 MAG: ATP-binding cassette domain-containing protein [Mesorhizobium sp.]RWD05074.1 MAG: ATP-binding cassette domain-containing protein [Mesorhizobium sp.]RWD14533.1 MAG: ATP-binding cassette domain-containing protein [